MRTAFASWLFAGAVALGLGLLDLSAQGQNAQEKGGHHNMYEKCAKECNDCQRICDMCAGHCADLMAQGKKEHRKTLATCSDCATFCSAAACIVARKGPFSDAICQSCADACARCGKACEHYLDDPMMKRCAEECKRCEQACKEMVKHAGSANTATTSSGH